MEIKLKTPTKPGPDQVVVTLSYKNGAKSITSRRPVIQVDITSDDLFSQNEIFEILLEAQNKDSDVIGEAKLGGVVNAASRTISLQPGDSQKVTIIMDEEFEGAFTIKALNPNTLVEFAKIKLKTDYIV